TGIPKIAPADARTTFGLYASTDPGPSRIAAAPAASALRRSVPRLPGSASATPTTTSPSPASASAPTAGRGATASTGCGVRVVPSFSSTPSFSTATGVPAATRAVSAGNATSALGPKY